MAVLPGTDADIVRAVEDGGGHISDASVADAIVWIDPSDPVGLGRVLESSPARWVQLPSAGIEPFVTAGVVDPSRSWTCAKGTFGHACAEHALGFMIMAARRMHEHARAHAWHGEGPDSRERRLWGCTVVVVGTGGIGAPLPAMLAPLGARVIGVNRSGRPLDGADRTVTIDELPGVLPEADFVVLAAAYTPATKGLFDAAMLGRMAPQAWLINVARGGLVDTDALVAALEDGSIGGAALDVTDPEPLPAGHPLWSLDDVIITPHVANTWVMGLPELCARIARNVHRFAAGEPLEGPVDPELGY
ncbi:MAG: D-isomer specific 2-hydroxyacid dehydrogenase family protein [Actinomycetota bacterium]